MHKLEEHEKEHLLRQQREREALREHSELQEMTAEDHWLASRLITSAERKATAEEEKKLKESSVSYGGKVVTPL